jgi:hypothetical protein
MLDVSYYIRVEVVVNNNVVAWALPRKQSISKKLWLLPSQLAQRLNVLISLDKLLL